MANKMGLKDSGARRHFHAGAVRDVTDGKGAFHLLPLFGILRGALQMERGAKKYASRNWERGIPLSTYLDSGLRHALCALAGFDDEPHVDAAIWNFMCLAETRERIRLGILPKKLDDLPATYKGLDFQKILRELKY